MLRAAKERKKKPDDVKKEKAAAEVGYGRVRVPVMRALAGAPLLLMPVILTGCPDAPPCMCTWRARPS